VILKTLRLPVEFQKLKYAAGLGGGVCHELLIGDGAYAAWKTGIPVRHQLAVEQVVARHFLLGVGIGTGAATEQLLVVGVAGVHGLARHVQDFRLRQCPGNSTEVEKIVGHLVDKARQVPGARAGTVHIVVTEPGEIELGAESHRRQRRQPFDAWPRLRYPGCKEVAQLASGEHLAVGA